MDGIKRWFGDRRNIAVLAIAWVTLFLHKVIPMHLDSEGNFWSGAIIVAIDMLFAVIPLFTVFCFYELVKWIRVCIVVPKPLPSSFVKAGAWLLLTGGFVYLLVEVMRIFIIAL